MTDAGLLQIMYGNTVPGAFSHSTSRGFQYIFSTASKVARSTGFANGLSQRKLYVFVGT